MYVSPVLCKIKEFVPNETLKYFCLNIPLSHIQKPLQSNPNGKCVMMEYNNGDFYSKNNFRINSPKKKYGAPSRNPLVLLSTSILLF